MIIEHIGKSFIDIQDKTCDPDFVPDGLTCKGPYEVIRFGPDKGQYSYEKIHNEPMEYIIDHCYFDNSNVVPKYADEAISVIWGAKAKITNTYIKNWGKALLIGNGDAPEEIDKDIHVELDHCIFDGCSRRHPYIQYGTVVMKNCLIRNWGQYFHEKSHGIKVSTNSKLYIENCVFWQDNFFKTNLKNFLADCYNQVLDFGSILDLFKPGVTRAIYSEDGGEVRYLKHCYKNKWWMSFGGYSNLNPMTHYEALMLIEELIKTVPQSAEEAHKWKK